MCRYESVRVIKVDSGRYKSIEVDGDNSRLLKSFVIIKTQSRSITVDGG